MERPKGHRMNVVDNCTENLTKSFFALTDLNASTENEFLSIGASLSDILNKSKELSDLAISVVSFFKDKKIEHIIDSLKTILDESNAYFDSSAGDISRQSVALKEILTMLGNVEKPLSGFRRIIKQLRVLGIATKIESARLTDGMGSFHTIAEDIDKLSVVIADRSSHIFSSIISLKDVITHASFTLQSVESAREKKAKDIFRHIIAGLDRLSETYRLSSDMTSLIAVRSEETVRSVSNVVSSLQFHDITRQQIEHVTESLREITQRLSSTNGDRDITQILTDIAVADVCDLESEQLACARNELCSAVTVIMDNLQKITSHIGQNLKDIMKVAGVDRIRDSSFSEDIRQSFVAIINSFKETIEAGAMLESAMREMASTIENLSSYLGDIEGIGEEIELIALNACIKAARTGSNGAALGVLADEVRMLSEKAMKETNVISIALSTIAHTSTIFDCARDTRGIIVSDKIETVLEQLTLSLTGIQNHAYPLLSRIEKGMNHLVVTINTIVSGITVHRRVEHAINDVITILKDTSSNVRAVSPHVSSQEKERQFKEFAERYTMHKERRIHYKTIAGQDESSLKDLGENVELF